MAKKDEAKLELWQGRRTDAQAGLEKGFNRIQQQQTLYQGFREILVEDGQSARSAPATRNICYEMIESQVSSDVPAPKVTALRQEDEWLAKMAEDMIRGELEQMGFDELNDMAQRIVPQHGGTGWHVEWDSSARTHTTTGEVKTSLLHPLMLLPQPGVYTGVDDMDYIILKMPTTKTAIKRRFGVDVSEEGEEEPNVRGGDADSAEDMVTLYVGYSKGDDGTIDKFSWVGDTVVEDIPDYLARRARICSRCGTPEPPDGEDLEEPTLDGTPPGGSPGPARVLEEPEQNPAKPGGRRRKTCPFCGGQKWEDAPLNFERITVPVSLGEKRGMLGPQADETGFMQPVEIPAYKPRGFPVVIQRNVSQYGTLLGQSDLDVIEDQQKIVNTMMDINLRKVTRGQTLTTLPALAELEDGPGMKVVRIEDAADAYKIGVHTLEGDVTQSSAMAQEGYEHARSALGVNDSFQGKRDPTATSGKAKEFAAAQTAGRLESKRVMQEAAYGRIFRLIFEFMLAYADEPRPVRSKDIHGKPQYGEFNRYAYLAQDAAGAWYWNDRFLFGVDNTAPLASNREAMWQETRLNFTSGAFGDPTSTETLLIFWEKMAVLHYPDAENTVELLRQRLQREQQEQAMAVAMQRQQIQMQQADQMAQTMGKQREGIHTEQPEGGTPGGV